MWSSVVLSVLGWRKQPDLNRTSPVTTSPRTYTTLRDSINADKEHYNCSDSEEEAEFVKGLIFDLLLARCI